MLRAAALVAAALVGIAGVGCRAREGAAPPPRRFAFSRVTFDPRGISPPLRVPVPPRTRSLAVVVRGHPAALYALAGLETAGGADQVALPPGIELAAAMRAAYLRDRTGEMPGALRQTIRLGLFTAVFPERPGAALPAGDLIVRVATSDPSHPADVVLLLPEELPGGPAVLPVVLFRWSASPPGGAAGLPFVDRLRSILAAGGIDLRVERIIDVTDPALAAMTGLSAPQEGPSSPSARLALRGGERVAGDALNLFIVDSLPPGVGGWTLGTPGPPLPDTIYSGVIAARLDQGDELARALAHEIGHYLGLRHVESSGPAGARLDDRLADTAPGTGNLMDEDHRGTGITRDQALVMRRHPLLVPRAPAAP